MGHFESEHLRSIDQQRVTIEKMIAIEILGCPSLGPKTQMMEKRETHPSRFRDSP